MKVLLCTLNAKYIHTNIAIRLLYDLNKDYSGLEWKEFSIKEDLGKMSEFCSSFDLVAFSCYIWNIQQTLALAKEIKTKKPHTQILLGGPEVSYEFNEIIESEYVDFIISGEGEIPFSTFLGCYPEFDCVPSLTYKKGNDIIQNPSGPNFDLENYRQTNIYAHDHAETLQNRILYIETSRGCPYKCEFCLASLDNKVRYLPMEHIKENLLWMMQKGKVIKFLDRTFNVKKAFTLEIFEFILENYRPQNVFQFEITADIVHPDIIQFIKERVPKGLFRFEIGIQTIHQKANLEVQRKQNFLKTKSIILQLRDYVEMHLDLIVGLPLDHFEDICYSINEVFALHPPELQLGFLKLLKGTPLRDKEEHGFVFSQSPPYSLIESKYLSKSELHQFELLEQVLEIYWNKARAKNCLLYIETQTTISPFLLSLGQFFSGRFSFLDAKLEDIYQIFYDYLSLHFDNPLAKELLIIDYYLHHKIRPKPWQNIEYTPERINMTKEKGQRTINLLLRFDFLYWREHQVILEKPFLLQITYTQEQIILNETMMISSSN
jgi:hypothetical protein